MALNSDLIISLLSSIEELQKDIKSLKEDKSKKTMFTNKTLQEYLGITNQTLKLYRDRGEIGFHRSGDKYWYEQKDVEAFLAKNYHPTFELAK